MQLCFKTLQGLIVNRQINELNKRVQSKGIEISATPQARKWLAIKGYVPALGARPLERLINNTVSKKLSKEILFGVLADGGRAVIDVVDNEIVITATAVVSVAKTV